MVPFKDNGYLTARQQTFNTALSSLRQKVERSISLLKGRWQKLKYLDHLDLELAVNIIIAACVLHNYCLLHDDFDDVYFLTDDDDDDDEGSDNDDGNISAKQKRLHLMTLSILNYTIKGPDPVMKLLLLFLLISYC